MSHNRLASLLETASSVDDDMPYNPFQDVPTSGFMAAPLVVLQQPTQEMWNWQCQLYRWAFEQAQAVVERSWTERDVLASWN